VYQSAKKMLAKNGYAPSIAELAYAVKLSVRAVHSSLGRLENAKRIRRASRLPRSLQLVESAA
jgi:SOS-response transcriptional repressor LexA